MDIGRTIRPMDLTDADPKNQGNSLQRIQTWVQLKWKGCVLLRQKKINSKFSGSVSSEKREGMSVVVP